MFSHVFVLADDYENSCKFYNETLSVLDIEVLLKKSPIGNEPMSLYMKKERKSAFILKPKLRAYLESNDINSKDTKKKLKSEVINIEEEGPKYKAIYGISFDATSVQKVEAWYEKCLELGAKRCDDGAPRWREDILPRCYSASLVDPNGVLINATFYTGPIFFF